MNLKILLAATFLSLLSWATPAKAQQAAQTDPLQQLPSRLDQLTNPSQARQFQKLIQQQEPLLYLFLQMQQSQPPNLQQQADAEARQILKQPPSLEQQLTQEEVHGKLRLDKL